MGYFNFEGKRVYFKQMGEGEPLLLLHGNTVSSKMFSSLLKNYSREYQLILLDFPGHGKSDRLESFPADFWFYNARVCDALISHLDLDSLHVIGSSGGALVGINLALEYPGKVRSLIADSFEGEYPLTSYIESLEADRARDKKKFFARLFWFYCHGWGWKKVVDMDTKVNLDFARSGKSFFHKPISSLKMPVLLTGSQQDEYCDNLQGIYQNMQKKNSSLKVHLFDEGNHPAILSNKEAFYEVVKEFIVKNAINV